ncbi:MAG: YigZ family protein [Ghiorsea sp.]|nr:YigZ family protein [Ghiorsea sp.]
MSYNIPQKPLIDEQIIKKSRFITHIARSSNKDEAKAFIQSIRAQYPDARHHCWAYIAGHPTASINIGFSDDGEPSGTAGKPILNVLQHRGVGEIVLVVVRYFGGIKLGAGGLVRAYSSSASLAMDKLETATLVPCKSFNITFDYQFEPNIQHLILNCGATIESSNYTERIMLKISIPTMQIETFNSQLINITAGKVFILS